MKNLKFIILIIILLVCYGLFIEPNRLSINYYKIQNSDLKGIKIVFASDFHIKPHQQKRLERIVASINAEKQLLIMAINILKV